jgi:hypothetical protein
MNIRLSETLCRLPLYRLKFILTSSLQSGSLPDTGKIRRVFSESGADRAGPAWVIDSGHHGLFNLVVPGYHDFWAQLDIYLAWYLYLLSHSYFPSGEKEVAVWHDV